MQTLAVLSFLATIILLALAGYSLVKKTGHAKRFGLGALAAFVLFVIFAGVSGSSQPPAQPGSAASGESQPVAQAPPPAPAQPPAQPANPEPESQPAATPEGKLQVYFLDVGQADSILVKFPGGQTMLVDAGNNDDGPGIVSYLKQQGVKKIDYLVATHPHEDHIGAWTR